jgi:hypothetical protein
MDSSPGSCYLSQPDGGKPTVRGVQATVRRGGAESEAVHTPQRTKRIVKTNEACHQRSRQTHSQRAFARGFKAKQHSPVAHVFPIPPLGPEVSHPDKRETEEMPAHKPGRLCRGRSVPSFSGRSGHSSLQNDPLPRIPSLQSSCS